MESKHPWIGVMIVAFIVLTGAGLSVDSVDRAIAGEASRS